MSTILCSFKALQTSNQRCYDYRAGLRRQTSRATTNRLSAAIITKRLSSHLQPPTATVGIWKGSHCKRDGLGAVPDLVTRFSTERAAMTLALKAMPNGRFLLLACKPMGPRAAHVRRKGIKLWSSPKKSFGLSEKTTDYPHLGVCLFIRINKNGCGLNSYFFLGVEEKKSKSICWLSCAISRKLSFQRSVTLSHDATCSFPPAQPLVLHTYLGTVGFWVTFHILHSSQSLKATNHPKRGKTEFRAVTRHLKHSCTIICKISNLCPLL